jgi:FtsP/CotA-like multicopper oxidase with cupredoxin domain
MDNRHNQHHPRVKNAGHHHHHNAHGDVDLHTPSADWRAAYSAAYEAAQPDPGRVVVRVDLDVREVQWEFEQGRVTAATGIGGRVPGPTIEARVGDVLEIHLTNHMAEPTVIHWHGLRIPAVMDGTESVQRPVMPGETFSYRFRLPDAGTFWYHSHFNEIVQLDKACTEL